MHAPMLGDILEGISTTWVSMLLLTIVVVLYQEVEEVVQVHREGRTVQGTEQAIVEQCQGPF